MNGSSRIPHQKEANAADDEACAASCSKINEPALGCYPNESKYTCDCKDSVLNQYHKAGVGSEKACREICNGTSDSKNGMQSFGGWSGPVAEPFRSPTSKAKPSETWSSQECTTVGGRYDASNQRCYAAAVSAPLGVSIGGLKEATLTTYIEAAYKYILGAAAILAVIYMMVGGFQWIIGEAASQKEAGKKRITHALIGLTLTFVSFTLLQTVNPELTKLQAPSIPLVKARFVDQLKTNEVQVGGPCYTNKDAAACVAACPKKGLSNAKCECTVVEDGMWETIAKYASLSPDVLLKIAKSGITLGGDAISAIYGYALNKPLVGAGLALVTGPAVALTATTTVLGYQGFKIAEPAPGEDPGRLGVCLPLADKSIVDGGVCAKPDNCKSGRCTIFNQEPPFGMCVSGAENTGCVVGSNDACGGGLVCCEVVNSVGTCQKSCAARAAGSTCATNSDCAGGVCATIPPGATSQDTGKKICTSGGSGDFCSSASECANGTSCPTALYSCTGSCTAYRQCATKGSSGDICCSNSECGSGSCVGADPDKATGQCRVVEGSCKDCGKCQ